MKNPGGNLRISPPHCFKQDFQSSIKVVGLQLPNPGFSFVILLQPFLYNFVSKSPYHQIFPPQLHTFLSRPPFWLYHQQGFCTAIFVRYDRGFRYLAALVIYLSSRSQAAVFNTVNIHAVVYFSQSVGSRHLRSICNAYSLPK